MCPWPERCPMLTDEIMIKNPTKEKTLWIIVDHTEKQICTNKTTFRVLLKYEKSPKTMHSPYSFKKILYRKQTDASFLYDSGPA